MQVGWLDDQTSANSGTGRGGNGSTNVVPDHCQVLGEARSLDRERVEAVMADMVDRVYDAANIPEFQCDVDISVERLFDGYRTRRTAKHIAVGERALRACGYEPVPIATGGGSDANAFEAGGGSRGHPAQSPVRKPPPPPPGRLSALRGAHA